MAIKSVTRARCSDGRPPCQRWHQCCKSNNKVIITFYDTTTRCYPGCVLQRCDDCSVTSCSLHSREEVCGRSYDREEAAPRPVMVTATMPRVARLPWLLLCLLTLAASVSSIQIISSSPHSSTVVPEGSWITAESLTQFSWLQKYCVIKAEKRPHLFTSPFAISSFSFFTHFKWWEELGNSLNAK